MKYILLVLALSVFAAAESSAQTEPGRWSLGITTGANLARPSLDSVPDGPGVGFLLGLIGGIRVEYQIDEEWAIRSGASFDQSGMYEHAIPSSAITRTTTELNGFKDDNSSYVNEFQDNVRLNYFVIPLTLKYSIQGSGLHPYVCLGTSLGMLLSATQTETRTVIIHAVSPTATGDVPPGGGGPNEVVLHVTDPTTNSDIRSKVNALNVSAIIGLGATIALSARTALMIEGEYNHGLTNVIKGQLFGTPSMGIVEVPLKPTAFYAPLTSTNPNAYTRDMRINVALMFFL